jgi:predicted SprT family Zn-dependent metalloprotease
VKAQARGRHGLPRAEQAKFRKALLAAEGHRCFYCGATHKPVQAHHITRTAGHMVCQSCHNQLTEENQLRGNPPPLP